MRAILIGLFAAALAVASFPAACALAAPSTPPISKDDRQAGMKAAPDLIQGAGLDCTLADARLVGTSTDPKTNAANKIYEIACTGGYGFYMATQPKGAAPVWSSCAELADAAAAAAAAGKPPGSACALPGNSQASTLTATKAYLAKASSSCVPDKLRAIGHNASATFLEVSCQGGGDNILQLSSPPRLDKPIAVSSCLAIEESSPLACKFTTREAQLGVIDQLAAQSGKSCKIKDRRYILTAQDGQNYYEIACDDGKGYVLQQATNGSLAKTIGCADADWVGGGCTLTNARQAQTEQASLYTKLAQKAGFDCTVNKYAPFSEAPAGHEVVELACSNRPDGAVGIFAASASEPSQILPCATSELAGYRCSFTPAQASYPALTANLKTLGKVTCTVSSARVVGVSADKEGFIEVACADGNPGFVIEYSTSPVKPKRTLVCSEAKGIGGGCKLPGNLRKS